MHNAFKTATILCAAALLSTGCKKTADNTLNYKSAIDTYYAAHPSCLWSQPMQFPAQVDTSDTSKTAPYDALFDQGLLTRNASEKKVLIIATKRVTNYDLSDNGRSTWTADTTQPGFGNFCYGHRTVQSIDSASPNNGQPGATTQVSYHFGFSGAPAWAQAAETQNAFPHVKADLSNGSATATLLDTNNGWQVQPPATSSQPVTGADGKIVE
jgi:hypothetical protein